MSRADKKKKAGSGVAKKLSAAGKKGNDGVKEVIHRHFKAMQLKQAGKIKHHIRLGLTDGQYGKLKAMAKSHGHPMSRMLRELIYGSTGSSEFTPDMEIIDSQLDNKKDLMDYCAEQNKTIQQISRVGNNLNQAVHKLNKLSPRKNKDVHGTLIQVNRAAREVESLFRQLPKQAKHAAKMKRKHAAKKRR